MVIRIAGYAYQKGFGGHFHNDNAVGALRDVPGLLIASPARPDDAAAMLRTCLAAAAVDGSVCVFLEPIALYHARDLYEDGDGGWLATYPRPDAHVPAGRARCYGDGTDLTVVTFGNGLRMSLRVARRLAVRGIGARVVDLRWLAPLPVDDLLREARRGLRGSHHRSGRRRLPGPDHARGQRGQLRAPRPGGERGTAGRARDRERSGRPRAGPLKGYTRPRRSRATATRAWR